MRDLANQILPLIPQVRRIFSEKLLSNVIVLHLLRGIKENYPSPNLVRLCYGHVPIISKHLSYYTLVLPNRYFHQKGLVMQFPHRIYPYARGLLF